MVFVSWFSKNSCPWDWKVRHNPSDIVHHYNILSWRLLLIYIFWPKSSLHFRDKHFPHNIAMIVNVMLWSHKCLVVVVNRYRSGRNHNHLRHLFCPKLLDSYGLYLPNQHHLFQVREIHYYRNMDLLDLIPWFVYNLFFLNAIGRLNLHTNKGIDIITEVGAQLFGRIDDLKLHKFVLLNCILNKWLE